MPDQVTEPSSGATAADDPAGAAVPVAQSPQQPGIYIRLGVPEFVKKIWRIRRRRYIALAITAILLLASGGYLYLRHQQEVAAHDAWVAEVVAGQQNDDLTAISSNLGGFLNHYGVIVVTATTPIAKVPVGSGGWWSPTTITMSRATQMYKTTVQKQVEIPANAVLTKAPAGPTSLFVTHLPTTDDVGSYVAFAFRICDVGLQPQTHGSLPGAVTARYVLVNAIVSGCQQR